MTPSRKDARSIETEYLAALSDRLNQARSWLGGSRFRLGQSDEREALRELMKARRVYDASLLDRLPNNRRLTLTGYVRSWYLVGFRPVSAITASVLSPLEEIVPGAAGERPAARPIDRQALLRHIDSLTSRHLWTHVIGVCSPSGFTDEAKDLRLDCPGLTVVLIEPREPGGWAVTGLFGPELDSARRLFDPEDHSEKRQRIRRAVEQRQAALMSTGLNAADLAAELGLDPAVVEATFRRLADENDRLNVTTTKRRACILYYTSTSVKETPPMSLMDFLKRILGWETSPDEKIRALRAKQVEIDDDRRALERTLDGLLAKESDLIKQGATSTTTSARQRLASQVALLRQEISLNNDKVVILSKQSQVLGRHIHNMEVAWTATPDGLPDSEDITAAAAAAETALEGLDEAYETVRTVSSAASQQVGSEEQAEILAEFEAEAAKLAKAEGSTPAQAPEPAAKDAEPPSEPEGRRREAEG